ncbi:MAG: LamG domain-containing protein [Gemmatimonadota bacterium]
MGGNFRCLNTLLIASLFLVACSSSTAPGTGTGPDLGPMVAYYPLDGNTNDASGNGHDAQNFGALPAPDRYGVAYHADAFNGEGAYQNTNTTFDFPERTVAFWFNMAAYTGFYQRVITQNCSTLQYGSFGLGIWPDSLLDARAGGNGSFSPDSMKVQTGKWYHIALVRRGGLEVYYVDGVAVDSSAATNGGSYSNNCYTMIGSTRIPDRFFDGLIDDVRVYDRALSASEVESLYTAGG